MTPTTAVLYKPRTLPHGFISVMSEARVPVQLNVNQIVRYGAMPSGTSSFVLQTDGTTIITKESADDIGTQIMLAKAPTRAHGTTSR